MRKMDKITSEEIISYLTGRIFWCARLQSTTKWQLFGGGQNQLFVNENYNILNRFSFYGNVKYSKIVFLVIEDFFSLLFFFFFLLSFHLLTAYHHAAEIQYNFFLYVSLSLSVFMLHFYGQY